MLFIFQIIRIGYFEVKIFDLYIFSVAAVRLQLKMATESSSTAVGQKKIRFDNICGAELIERMFLKEETADVLFEFAKATLPAHKNILAERSRVFYEIFYGRNKSTNKKAIIAVTDASCDAFKVFLGGFYCQQVELSAAVLKDVMHLARLYRMTNWLLICDQFVENALTVNELCLGCELAIETGRVELKDRLLKRISLSPEFFARFAFVNCSRLMLKHILEIKIYSCNASVVVDGCIEWAEQRCNEMNRDSTATNIRQQLGDLLHLLPINGMTVEQISQLVRIRQDLFVKDELLDIWKLLDGSCALNSSMIFKRQEPYKRWVLKKEESRLILKRSQAFSYVLVSIQHDGPEDVKKLSGNFSVWQRTNDDLKLFVWERVVIDCRKTWPSTHLIPLKEPISFEKYKRISFEIAFDDSWSPETFFTVETSSIVPLWCTSVSKELNVKRLPTPQSSQDFDEDPDENADGSSSGNTGESPDQNSRENWETE